LALKKKFSQEDSVRDVHVTLDNQTAYIDVKDNQELSDSTIESVIEWGGYDLISIERAE